MWCALPNKEGIKMTNRPVDQSYKVQTTEDARDAYDHWSVQYEADLCATGYRIPAMIATVFSHHIPLSATPILDAGCGGGIQAEPLVEIGYKNLVGIDFSEGMLEVAKQKSIYSSLKQQTMGEILDFPDNHFEAVICSGVITPGHAPANSFDELIRVTDKGGKIIFSLRSDEKQMPEYPQKLEELSSSGVWEHVFSTRPFHSMPYGEPDVLHQVHVYKVV